MARPRKSSAPEYTRWRGRVLWARFQYSDDLRKTACDLYGVSRWPALREWSLETGDPLKAQHLLLPDLRKHLELRMFHKAHTADVNMGNIGPAHIMTPGTRETHPDGSVTVATDTVIMHLGPDGLPVGSETNHNRLHIDLNDIGQRTPEFQALMRLDGEARAVTHKDPDREAIDRYCANKRKDDVVMVWAGVNGVKDLTEGKPLSRTRKGEVLQFIEEEIARRATDENPLKGFQRVMRMIKFCAAALNAHVDENPVDSPYDQGRNPFARQKWAIIGEDYRGKQVQPFTEHDIATIKSEIAKFTRSEYLMIAMHCAMSVRPIGLASVVRDDWIDEEEYDDDVQLVAHHRNRVIYIEHDKGGRYGCRRLPLPQCLLDAQWHDGSPLLPETIAGPLFPNAKGTVMDYRERAAFLVQINNKLEHIGVATADKTLYSGRHRARQRLNACRFDDIRKLIMGHARKLDPHDVYGGYRAFEIKKWIDVIKF